MRSFDFLLLRKFLAAASTVPFHSSWRFSNEKPSPPGLISESRHLKATVCRPFDSAFERHFIDHKVYSFGRFMAHTQRIAGTLDYYTQFIKIIWKLFSQQKMISFQFQSSKRLQPIGFLWLLIQTCIYILDGPQYGLYPFSPLPPMASLLESPATPWRDQQS